MKGNLLGGLLFSMGSFLYVMFSHHIFPPLMLFQHIPKAPALQNHSVLNYNMLYTTVVFLLVQYAQSQMISHLICGPREFCMDVSIKGCNSNIRSNLVCNF